MSSAFSMDVNEADFQQFVVEASVHQPVLVDFWATWCQPCQILKPLLEKLADEYQGKFLLAKVNTEENQNLAMMFGIRSIPTVKMFVNGEAVDEFMGALPENQLREFLERHIKRESDLMIMQAEELLLQGQSEEAIHLIKQANQADPDNHRVLVAYARACATIGNSDEAKAVLAALPADMQEQADVIALKNKMELDEISRNSGSIEELQSKLEANPDDHETRYQLAALQAMHGDVEGALDNLLVIMRKDRSFNDDAARKMMFKIFESLGANNPLTGIYRRKMMSLFY
jgi:putative thioredoxin